MGYIMRHHQELKKTNLKESLSTVNRYVWFLLGRDDWMCVIVADYRSRPVWCEWVRHEAREHELLTSTSLTETEETGAEQMVSGHWCRDWVTLICGHHSNNLVPPSMWDNMRANSDSESVFVQVRVPVFEDVMKWCSYDPPKGQKGCQDICLSFPNLDNFSLCSHESCSQMSPHAADWQMSGAAWHNDITHLLRCCGITLPRPVTTRPGLWLVSQAQGRPLMGHFGSQFTVGCGQL